MSVTAYNENKSVAACGATLTSLSTLCGHVKKTPQQMLIAYTMI